MLRTSVKIVLSLSGSRARDPLGSVDSALEVYGFQAGDAYERSGQTIADFRKDNVRAIRQSAPSAVAQAPKTAAIRIRSPSRQKSRQTRQNDQAHPPRRSREASVLLPGCFHTTKTQC